MKRRFAAALMACLMAVALVVPANAVQTRAVKSGPRLYFMGTTVVWKRSGGDLDRKRQKHTGNVQDPHRAERTDLHAEGFLHGQRRDHKASPPSPKPVPKQPPAIRETKFLYRKDARLPEEEFQPIERKQLVRKLAELMRGLGLKYQRVLHLSWDIHLMFRRA